MNHEAREIYQKTILTHNKAPKNFRAIKESTHYAEGHNPLCGDSLELYIILDERGIIKDISFLGKACAITTSATSMMTEALKNKSETEARDLIELFQQLITGKITPDEARENLGELAIFSGIRDYPSRIKCASLSWHTVKAALNKEKLATTE